MFRQVLGAVVSTAAIIIGGEVILSADSHVMASLGLLISFAGVGFLVIHTWNIQERL